MFGIHALSKLFKLPAVRATVTLLATAGLLFLALRAYRDDNSTPRDRGKDTNPQAASVESSELQTITHRTEDKSARGKLSSQASVDAVHSISPMPSLDTALAGSLDALIDRAEAGDAEAACRVVLDFRACWGSASARAQALKYRAMAEDTSNEIERAKYVRLSAAYFNQESLNDDLCKDMRGFGHIESEFHSRIANGLANLSVHQKVLLAMTDPNGNLVRLPSGTLIDLDDTPLPSLIFYPQYLTDMDLQALDEGIQEADPLALEGKIILHMPTPMAKFMGLRESLPNAYLFAKYTMMQIELFGPDSIGGLATAVFSNLKSALPDDRRDELQADVEGALRQWRARSKLASKERTTGNAQPRELCMQDAR